jgi:hypothetical protein
VARSDPDGEETLRRKRNPKLPAGVVRRLHRIHVLVVSQDVAFLRTATERLSREGFVVDGLRAQWPEPEQIARSTDVVLLDHGGSLVETLRWIGALEALDPRVVVLVAAEGVNSPAGLKVPLVARSCSSRRLAEAVERAHLRWPGGKEAPADVG